MLIIIINIIKQNSIYARLYIAIVTFLYSVYPKMGWVSVLIIHRFNTMDSQ